MDKNTIGHRLKTVSNRATPVESTGYALDNEKLDTSKSIEACPLWTPLTRGTVTIGLTIPKFRVIMSHENNIST